jgi:hypothetical protein
MPRYRGSPRRRRRRTCVLGQHRDHGLYVVSLPGVDVALHGRAQPLVPYRPRGLLLASLRQPLVDRGPGALEGAVHRGDRVVERDRRLPGGEAQHLPQQKHGPLLRWQHLKRRDESEFDRLPPLAAGLRDPAAVLDRQGLRGLGLPPGRLDRRFADALVGVGRRWVVDRQDPLGALPDRVQRGVGRNPVEPAAKRAASLEPGETFPGTYERFLQRILGVLWGAEHPSAVSAELGAMWLDELDVGIVAGHPASSHVSL